MRRGLLVRPGYDGDLVPDFLRNSAAYVGWDKLGDLAGFTPASIDELLLRVYPSCRLASGAPKKHYREIIDFALIAEPGDFVVTPDRAASRFIVGEIAGPYRFDSLSKTRSGGEVFRHTLPVRWTHAVSRSDLTDAVFKDTDQRGKTAFWLRDATTATLSAAPSRSLVG